MRTARRAPVSSAEPSLNERLPVHSHRHRIERSQTGSLIYWQGIGRLYCSCWRVRSCELSWFSKTPSIWTFPSSKRRCCSWPPTECWKRSSTPLEHWRTLFVCGMFSARRRSVSQLTIHPGTGPSIWRNGTKEDSRWPPCDSRCSASTGSRAPEAHAGGDRRAHARNCTH